MPQENISVSVIIPAYNEAERIPKTLRRVQEYFSARSFSYEIIVVDNNCTDATVQIAERYGDAPLIVQLAQDR